MRVVVEPPVFTRITSTPYLICLFHEAADGHHRIDIDEEAPEYVAWLTRIDPALRVFCEETLALAYVEEASRPARHVIRIADVPRSSWFPPRLSLVDAVRYLQRPFRVLVEDGVSDRGFLLTAATPEQRELLLRFEQLGFLEFAHGGGLSSMTRRIERDRDDPGLCMRTWVMSDSDALQPGAPATPANRLREACGNRIPVRQLSRRCIENYLPKKAVSAWAYSGPRRDVRKLRSTRAQAYFSLTPAQRHHFNTKRGFNGDAARLEAGETAGQLYATVTPETREALLDGLDPGLAALYDPPGTYVSELDFRADGSWSELNRMVIDLVAHLG